MSCSPLSGRSALLTSRDPVLGGEGGYPHAFLASRDNGKTGPRAVTLAPVFSRGNVDAKHWASRRPLLEHLITQVGSSRRFTSAAHLIAAAACAGMPVSARPGSVNCGSAAYRQSGGEPRLPRALDKDPGTLPVLLDTL